MPVTDYRIPGSSLSSATQYASPIPPNILLWDVSVSCFMLSMINHPHVGLTSSLARHIPPSDIHIQTHKNNTHTYKHTRAGTHRHKQTNKQTNAHTHKDHIVQQVPTIPSPRFLEETLRNPQGSFNFSYNLFGFWKVTVRRPSQIDTFCQHIIRHFIFWWTSWTTQWSGNILWCVLL